MLKFVFLLLFSGAALSQHKYVSLQNTKVYDVEIIVFAYKNTPLPNPWTYTNKSIFDDSQALTLLHKPDHLPYIKQANNLQTTTDTKQSDNPAEYVVAIEDEENNQQVLAWFEHDKSMYKLSAIWDRLLTQQDTMPLIHQAWRQTRTPFNNPVYVKISSANSAAYEIDASGNFINTTASQLGTNTTTIDNLVSYPDFTVHGMVALSQGKFMHFGHKLNLFRLYNSNNSSTTMKNMVFSLVERKQISPGKLHYFDSPWFGSIVKITRYRGK
ncbi:hypothetical protein MNBD_GAMMA01-917 [hydrothermal vent metagenome]|uniref:Uncharacterized protein n=1 Tax=hydrothermal vent metagenome TaxID=652676 RepID=A0A3B0V4T5_9ZZZZ